MPTTFDPPRREPGEIGLPLQVHGLQSQGGQQRAEVTLLLLDFSLLGHCLLNYMT